jgi:hypothetical protein
MPSHVTDPRSNFNDQITHAVNVLKKSPQLQRVFIAVCSGGRNPKTVAQLMKATKFSQVAVAQLGGKLADQGLISKSRNGKIVLYEKDRFYATNRPKIFGNIKNPKKFAQLPTKVSPKGSSGTMSIKLSIKGAAPKVSIITCDDVDQFSAVRKIRNVKARKPLAEKKFKKGIQKLLGEGGKFTDWGGEPNDLYTVKAKFKGKRKPIAFAFKGPATKGPLTPKKLGKNGDQIQRLFLAPAEVFFVQYHGQITQSIYEQMDVFATVTWLRTKKNISYCVIDADDTNRLLAAYPKQFGLS